MIKSTTYLLDRGWIVNFRPGEDPSSPLIIALHGWTGTELSMHAFHYQIPSEYSILSPRGTIPAEPTGYGWVHKTGQSRDWEIITQRLHSEIDEWLRFFNLKPKSRALLGFSQGGALVYSMCSTAPEIYRTAAVLAGFLPSHLIENINQHNLSTLKIYIAHGSNDDVIKVESARKAARLCQAAGAAVTYCESDFGHKLSAGCAKGLQEFFLSALQQTN